MGGYVTMVESLKSDLSELRQERNTLISVLKECVVALGSVNEELSDMASLLMESQEQEDSTLGKAWRALLKQSVKPALTHAKSTLSKYER